MTEPTRPNIVWITLDSVRADHTTMGGYERNTTPSLQRLADDDRGRYFEQCISHGRYTRVSTTSMLTGTYPSQHRIGYDNQAIPSTLPTVAERLAEQSYRTGLLSDNAFVSDALGLDRGFDRTACLVPSSVSDLPKELLQTVGWEPLVRYLLGLRRHSVGFSPDLTQHSRTYLLDTVARQWLSAFSNEEPFFLYLHNDETHRPYSPPLPYRDEFTDEIGPSADEAATKSLQIHDELVEIVAEGCDLTDDEWDSLLAMYDATLRYVDEWIGDFVEYLRNGPFGETIIVVTADHGEFFGEHGLLAHKCVLDDAVLNVPLVTYGLDIDTDGLVQHTDVMATLLECAGADTEGIRGVDLRREDRDYAIAQDHAISTDEVIRSHNPDADVSRYATSERSVIHDGEYKLRLDDDGHELYRLPDETSDVSAQNPERVEQLTEYLTAWLESKGQAIEGDTQNEFSAEMRSHLSDLGYLEDELPER